MFYSTFQIGIDIGLKNCKVVVKSGPNPDVAQNFDRENYTPCFFGVDESGHKAVGKRAYWEYYFRGDLENFKGKIKNHLGSDKKFHFKRARYYMTADEILAEILKYLKKTVKKYSRINKTAAVITAPVHFDDEKLIAIKKSLSEAKFKHAFFLQEPIAAAAAYNFLSKESRKKDKKWLVFDLGEKSFTVSIVAIENGNFTVKNYLTEKFLSGEVVDKLVLNKIIIPHIKENYAVQDFYKENKKYENAFRYLRFLAEEAKTFEKNYIGIKEFKKEVGKLVLNIDSEFRKNKRKFIGEKVTISISNIGQDDEKRDIILDIHIFKSEFENLIKHLVNRFIKTVKHFIDQLDYEAEDFEKIVLSGGLAKNFYIESEIKKNFSIPINCSIDPMIVNAQGATIFGATQKVPYFTIDNQIRIFSIKEWFYKRLKTFAVFIFFFSFLFSFSFYLLSKINDEGKNFINTESNKNFVNKLINNNYEMSQSDLKAFLNAIENVGLNKDLLDKENINLREIAALGIDDLLRQSGEEGFEKNQENIENIVKIGIKKSVLEESKKLLKKFNNETKIFKNNLNEQNLINEFIKFKKNKLYLKKILEQLDLIQRLQKKLKNPKMQALINEISKIIKDFFGEDVKVNIQKDKLASSLGIEVNDGIFRKMLQGQKPLPLENKKIYKTRFAYQKTMFFDIYQGEERIAKKNKFIDRVYIYNLVPLKNTGNRVEVILSINKEGKIRLKAKDLVNPVNSIDVYLEKEVGFLSKKVNKKSNAENLITLKNKIDQIDKKMQQLVKIIENEKIDFTISSDKEEQKK